jgi:DNA-binding NarL/FixJ family response regulator
MNIRGTMAITIAPIEDNANIRAATLNILESDPDCQCVGVFSSGEQAPIEIPKLYSTVLGGVFGWLRPQR